MTERGSQATSRTNGHIGQEDSAYDAEHAHGEYAHDWPAGVSKPVVVAERRDWRMPEAPDDAADEQSGHDGQPLCQLRHEVSAPAPLLAEHCRDVQKRPEKHAHGNLDTCQYYDAWQIRLYARISHLPLQHGCELGTLRIKIAWEYKEANHGTKSHEDRGTEPCNEKPRKRLALRIRFEHAVLESLAGHKARERNADGR